MATATKKGPNTTAKSSKKRAPKKEDPKPEAKQKPKEESRKRGRFSKEETEANIEKVREMYADYQSRGARLTAAIVAEDIGVSVPTANNYLKKVRGVKSAPAPPTSAAPSVNPEPQVGTGSVMNVMMEVMQAQQRGFKVNAQQIPMGNPKIKVYMVTWVE